MGVFDKVMASAFGVGSTKVDTVVNRRSLMPGARIQGVCKIYGGKIEQYINKIAINVFTNYEKESGDSVTTESECIQTHYLEIEQTINANEMYEVDFSFILDKRVPVTAHKSKVWLSTRLDIENGVDSSDRDYLNIGCNDYMENIIYAIEMLGFSIREIENEYCRSKLNGLKFVQEFEFVPTRGYFRGRLDELELVFIPEHESVDIILQIDRKVRGFSSFLSESMGLDETNLRFTIEDPSSWSVEQIKAEIEDVIRQYA